jgi:DNA modification methylase
MIEVIHWDCLEVMKTMKDNSVDLVLTDPPYLISSSKPWIGNNIGSLKKYNSDDYINLTNWFNIELVFDEFKRICKKMNMFCFCSNDQLIDIMSYGKTNSYYTTLLVRNKTNSAPFANFVWRQDAEFIVHIREKWWYFRGGAELKKKVTQLPTNHSVFWHPTEKPIDLIRKYIQIWSGKWDMVLDCFAWSWTTWVACKELWRDCILIEKEQKYIDVINKRLDNTTVSLFH